MSHLANTLEQLLNKHHAHAAALALATGINAARLSH
jgi:hypothetical protein